MRTLDFSVSFLASPNLGIDISEEFPYAERATC